MADHQPTTPPIDNDPPSPPHDFPGVAAAAAYDDDDDDDDIEDDSDDSELVAVGPVVLSLVAPGGTDANLHPDFDPADPAEAAAAFANAIAGPVTADNANLNPSPPAVPITLPPDPYGGRGRYSTQDVRSVWVKPVSGYQSIERRFGPKAREHIYAKLHGNSNHGVTLQSDDSDSEDEDEHVSIAGHGNSGSDNDDGIDNNDGSDEDLPDANSNSNSDGYGSTAGSTPSTSTPPPLSDAEALENAFTSLNGGPPGDTAAPEAPQPLNFQLNKLLAKTPPKVPGIARARMNLTALSQHYNLYFAVYHDEIHVFRPQPAPEILRGPLLVLKPPPTAAGRQLGGHMSPRCPHQPNHIKIGELGGVEIVLLAYDDGDVVAYYTRHIATYLEEQPKHQHLQRRQKRPTSGKKVPQPFFRETVGMTAWGLAIHSQSRLIAVSSNLAEVNVFAFALQPPHADDPLQHKTQPLVVPSYDLSPTTYAGATALELESLLRMRDRYWRILLPLGPSGHNIPSIDFISDSKGIAEKVAAIDINGSIYILDIWKVGSRPLKIPSPHLRDANPVRRHLGWGVMILPISMFRLTNRMPAMPATQLLNRYNYPNIDGHFYFSYLNDPARRRPRPEPVTVCLEDDTGSSDSSDVDMDDYEDDTGSGYETDQPTDDDDDEHDQEFDSSEEGENDDDSDNSSQSDYIVKKSKGSADSHMQDSSPYRHARTDSTDSAPFTYDPATMSRNWDALLKNHRNSIFSSPDYLDLKKDAASPFHLGQIICPSIGLAWPNSNLQKLIGTLKNSRWRLNHSREEELREYRFRPSQEIRDMAQRFFILRTYSDTIELVRTDPMSKPFYIHNVIKPPSRLPFTLWDMGRDFHRCSLLHCIPEINLVFVGNMFGRVALLRPIKNNKTPHDPSAASDPPDHAFRVEWTLPLARDEQQGLRPPCCLLGIAVSAVPEPGSGRFGVNNTRKPQSQAQRTKRWRLILHYMDHSIFQYYIEETRPKGVPSLRVY